MRQFDTPKTDAGYREERCQTDGIEGLLNDKGRPSRIKRLRFRRM